MKAFTVGDVVVCCVSGHSKAPQQDARIVVPSERGEGYSYVVDRFWRVIDKLDERHLLVRTTQGSEFEIDVDDHRLRPVSWWERLFRSRDFPSKEVQQKQR